MVLKDIDQNILISNQAQMADSFMDRLLGLLNPRNSRYLVFHTHFGIHSFFMSKPIDVLLLDNNQKIIRLKQKLVPFRMFFYNPQYSTVIEMPQGTIRRLRLHINDKIFIG